MQRTFAAIAAGLLLLPASAGAQELLTKGARQHIGFAIGDRAIEPPSMPVITMRRTADYAVQAVKISGDTREDGKRRDEIYAMIRGAIELATKSGVELAIGDYVVEPLTLANYRNLTLRYDGRPDAERASFLVKTKLAAGMDAKSALDRISKFIAAVPAVGRAEMEAVDDLTLSVVNPDQYRGQIIDLIAADAAANSAKFGSGYGVEVTGLDRPVEWARASLTEVFLYLPSRYVIRPRAGT